jgi:hypothetical protein
MSGAEVTPFETGEISPVLREGQTAAFEFTVTQDKMAVFAGAAGFFRLLAADYKWLHVDTLRGDGHAQRV